MEWIKNIEKGNSLSGKRIVITGCGFKEHKCKFTDITTGEDSSNYIYAFNNNIKKTQKLKLNIGSAIAFSLAAKGAIVHLVSTSEDKLKIIKERIVHELGIDEDMVEYSTLDLLHEKEVKNLNSRKFNIYICKKIKIKIRNNYKILKINQMEE